MNEVGGVEATQRTPPQWVGTLHRVATFGHPDQESRRRQLDLWQDYSAQMAANPRTTKGSLAAAELGSALAHVAWRVRTGAPTLAMPTFLLLVVGGVLLVSAAAEAFTLADQGVAAAVVASISVATVADLRATSGKRPLSLRVAWLIATLLTFTHAVFLYANPSVPGVRISAVGGAIISFGFFLRVLRISTRVRPPLAVVTVGTAVLATGTWTTAAQLGPSASSALMKLVAALITAIAFLLARTLTTNSD